MVTAVAMGLFGGMAAVFVFNKIPPKWLTDYGEEPPEELWGKRLKEAHFIPLLSGLFIWVAYTLMKEETCYLIAGFLAVWLLVLITVADLKYMIIPDQFTVALAIVALGLIPYHGDLLSPLYGALAGAGTFYLIGLLGRLLFKKDAMGFGDVKLMGAIGILAGFKGVLLIMFIAVLTAGIVLGGLLLSRRIKRDEERPLGPFIAVSAGAYILFHAQLWTLVDWYLGLF